MKPLLHLALLISSLAAAQQTAAQQTSTQQRPFAPSPEPTQDLQRLGSAADALAHSLPSFTCQEMVISQRRHGKKVDQQTNFTANLRVNRAADGSLSESFLVTNLNGNPFSGGSFNSPVYVSGGFDRAMIYFSPSLQPCFHYQLSAHRIDFESAPDPTCTYQGTRGFALLDADGNVTHLERNVSPDVARHLGLADFAVFDFSDVNLNGRTYRLSRHLLAEVNQGRTTGRFEATYANCHLFAATVTIGPATEIPPDNTTKPQ
jgi:hypothetical protein